MYWGVSLKSSEAWELALAGVELGLPWALWPSHSLPLPRSPGAATRVVLTQGKAPLMEFRGRPHTNS